jgi:hypothetical protein
MMNAPFHYVNIVMLSVTLISEHGGTDGLRETDPNGYEKHSFLKDCNTF